MTGPGLRRALARELGRMGRRPLYPLLGLLLPLAAYLTLTALFWQRVPRELPLAVEDRDRSALSRTLVRMVDAAPGLKVAHRVEGGGETLLREGAAYALLVIPRGFELDARRGRSSPVTAFINNQWMLTAGTLSRELRTAVGTLSAGIEIRRLRAAGAIEEEALQRSRPLRVEGAALFNPRMDYSRFLLAGFFPALFQLFAVLVTVQALGEELREGSAGEWLASGGGLGGALAGKLIPHAALLSLQALAMLALLFGPLAAPLAGGVPQLLGMTLLLVAACQGLGLLLVAFTCNLRLAGSLAAFITGPAIGFAGLTFPLISMPVAARGWSALLPLTHYLHFLLQGAMRGSTARAPLTGGGSALALIALLTTLASLGRLGRAAREPRCWGRR